MINTDCLDSSSRQRSDDAGDDFRQCMSRLIPQIQDGLNMKCKQNDLTNPDIS